MARLTSAFTIEQLRWYAKSANQHGYFTTTFWLRLPIVFPAIRHVTFNGVLSIMDGLGFFCFLMDSVVPMLGVWMVSGFFYQMAVYRLLSDPNGKRRTIAEMIDETPTWSKIFHVRSYLLVSIVHDAMSCLSMTHLGRGIAAQVATYIVLSVLEAPFHAIYTHKVLLSDPASARQTYRIPRIGLARLLLLPGVISASARSLAIVLSITALQQLFAIDLSAHADQSGAQQVAIALCWTASALMSWSHCAIPAYGALLLAEGSLLPLEARTRITIRRPPAEHRVQDIVSSPRLSVTLTDSSMLAKWSYSALPSCRTGSAALWLLAAVLVAFFSSPSADCWYPSFIIEQMSR